MPKIHTLPLLLLLSLASACSPRDFLTRRLAADLIAGSPGFSSTQELWLRTGVVSNRDYLSPEYMVLQHHGWITGSNAACPVQVGPAPCWDVALTPGGVNVFRDLIPNQAPISQYFSVPSARRELVEVTGISKDDQTAEVDFQWKWVPLNAVGAALYNEQVQYISIVAFRHYDDGWRVIETTPAAPNQGLDDALKNAVPAQ